jgi:outer membrane protein
MFLACSLGSYSKKKDYQSGINYKMKNILAIITLFFLFCFQDLNAQKKWTLEDCINYAVTNNIGLQRQRLLTESKKTDLLVAKMNLLPNLNAQTQLILANGRSIDSSNNIAFNKNLTNTMGIGSDIVLFNGFSEINTIAANKFMLRAGLESEKIKRNALVADILAQYYQVLYARGLESASKMHLELSEKQLFRITKMVETGKEALAKQYEIESQVSADRLSYTIAHNTASQSITTLKQMLQLAPGTEFDIVTPDLSNAPIADSSFGVDSVYKLASQNLPRLKEVEYELSASKKQIAVARGNIAPRLTANASIGSYYYYVLNAAFRQNPYDKQINDDVSKQVGVSLTIPIFNNLSNYRSINTAKLRKKDNELRLELEKNNLYTDIENACLNYNRGKDEFAAANANFYYNKQSYAAVEKKFESGLVDVTDFSLAKTTLFKAETEALRTKLQLLIRKLTIQFYSTGDYENLVNQQ